ncbi:ATP-binding cassette sub-family C member 9-like [Macrobrachium rosenbergii]|uniref:ATP-binding cassette sub-family C member 9-like n=1 Tax=Macrobrachium rosenbergii TaxID=79674 RepID=UPI0034D75E1D
MEAYRSSTRDDALAAALSLEMPKTCDLFATALQGLWLWVLFLAFLFRGLCARSAAPRPASLLPAHNYRTVAALCIVLVQVVSFADVIWRFHRSAEPHVLLIPAAGLTLVSSLATAAFYHATERWCAPGYVWVCLWVWIFQVGLGMWRVWQIARSGMQMILVYPCLTIANTVVAAFILSLDLYTVMLWTYRQRRCEVLEITPGLDDAATLGSPPSDADSTGKGEGNTGNANTTGGITYAHPRCSLPSRATFLWFLRVLKLGWKRPLEFTDLGKLPREEEANYQYERFHRCYNEQKMNAATSRTLRGHEVSLWRVFFLVYWREMLAGGILKFLGDSVNYVGPLAISAIVIYVSSVQEGQRRPEGVVRDGLYYVGWQELVTNGWVVACMALAASLAQSTFSQASTHLLAMEGIHVKAALQGMVYHKSLRLPSTSAAEPNSPHDEREGEDTRHKRGGSNSSSSSSSTVGGRNTSSTTTTTTTSGHAGTVINLSSEDADNIMTFFMHCHYIWAIPLKIVVILVLLWFQLGLAAVVAAVIGILCLTPLQFLLCKNIAAVNKNFLSVSDERLRQTHELVTGVKLVKLHAWENVFVKRITKVREKELGLLYCDSILRALMTFLTQGSGVVVSLVTFGLYSPLEGVALEPSSVFSGLALFQQLTVPLFILPIIVSHSIRAKSSAQRLREFFSLPEVEGPKTPRTSLIFSGQKERLSRTGKSPRNSKDEKFLKGAKFTPLEQLVEDTRPSSTYSNASTDSAWSCKRDKENRRISASGEICSSDSEEEREFERWKKRKSVLENEGRSVAVSIQGGSFTWDNRKKLTALDNVNVSIPAGGLTVVIGSVGSGKTSLLQALLGEMVTLKGQLRWTGEMSVAYVSQHPWLLNATLRDNILFGRRLLAKRYQRVLQACALKPDIEILPAGDQTEIGERGINLSGGQRQRIAIGRALYSDARTVIMDSPFSALDRGVAAQVWEEGVLKLLLSRRRTVILATHLTHLARRADKVLYLEGGKIKYQGSPAEIAASLPSFWKEWIVDEPLKTLERGHLEGRTARERWKLLRTVTRITIQRASMSRALRREGREESKEPHYWESPVRHYSINRHVSHNALLPGDECEYLPALTPPLPRHASMMEKKPLFRIKSSAPALGRKGSQPPQKCLPRHAKSLPPQPRPLQRMRSSPAVVPHGNMLQRLFSSASIRSNKKPSTSGSDKWHLGRILTSNSIGEDDLEEDLELEEEVPLADDVENGKLVSEEERERGKISKWNYVVYMRACGLGLCLSYLICAFAGQGVSVGLDFWLEKWSGKANAWNATHQDNWKEPQSFLGRQTPRVEITQNISELYDVFVKETMHDHYPTYAILSVLSIFLSLSTNLLGQVAAGNGRKKIHQDMLMNIVSCSVRFFDVTPAGRIMNRFTTDTAMIDKELARSVTHLLFFVLLVTSAVVVNAIITPIFLVVAVPICFIYYFIQKFFRCSSRELKRLESLSRSPLYSHLSESVCGATVIRAYGDQQRFADVFLHRLDTHVLAFTLLHAGNRWLGISLDYIGGIIVFLATLASLLWSTVFGDLSPAKVGLAISYTLLVPVYLNWVVRFLADTEMCLNAVERVHQYTTLGTEESPYTKRRHRSLSPANNQHSSGISSISYRSTRSASYSTLKTFTLPQGWPLEGKVDFQNVTLTYDRTLEPVLTELNFSIRSGEKVGLCGRTGSGKSSLILSLYRLVECLRGRILIDGTDTQHVPLATLRGSISVIPQDTHLFCGTVRFNLDPQEQHPDEHLWQALETAQLKTLISSMPNGLNSEVAEGGTNFSAGQRQLFCVARAILRRSSLLVLDEATSALDANTERALHHALDTSFSRATVITIAHGVNSLLEYPRVLVLENGKLVEDGDPKELSKKENGAFAKLLKAANEPTKP